MRRGLFLILGLAALVPGVPTWAALLAGVAFGLSGAHPFAGPSKQWATTLLQASVVALGAGTHLDVVVRVGLSGVGQTLATIAATLLAARALARVLATERVTSLLIGVGTAICGGSAIAAVAPAIGAKAHQTSVALAVVFLLNALALVLFPPLGHLLGLTPAQFGSWAALAIHDTSSVVGAGMAYGAQALEVGTTLKLTRALWIVPVTMLLAWAEGAGGGASGARRPWFILGFLAMAALVTWVPALQGPGTLVAAAGRQVLVLTLFLIGASVNREALRAVGVGPMVLGLVLWVAVAAATLGLVLVGVM